MRYVALLLCLLLAGCVQMKGPCKRTATTVTQCEAGGSVGGVSSPSPVIIK